MHRAGQGIPTGTFKWSICQDLSEFRLRLYINADVCNWRSKNLKSKAKKQKFWSKEKKFRSREKESNFQNFSEAKEKKFIIFHQHCTEFQGCWQYWCSDHQFLRNSEKSAEVPQRCSWKFYENLFSKVDHLKVPSGKVRHRRQDCRSVSAEWVRHMGRSRRTQKMPPRAGGRQQSPARASRSRWGRPPTERRKIHAFLAD